MLAYVSGHLMLVLKRERAARTDAVVVAEHSVVFTICHTTRRWKVFMKKMIMIAIIFLFLNLFS